MINSLLTVVFWAGLGAVAVCLLACIAYLLILVEDWVYWHRLTTPTPPSRQPASPYAQERYEAWRDAETKRMMRTRDWLDELWADEEDPLSEKAADYAMYQRELGEHREAA